MEDGHHIERIKQAKQMLTAGAATRVHASRLGELESIAAETAPATSGPSVWEAAGAADLLFEYETAYRGLGIAGAHASLRSLDSFVPDAPDGSVSLSFNLETSARRVSWLLGLIATCLSCGIERLRDVQSSARSDGSID
jgi:hypothetical protein